MKNKSNKFKKSLSNKIKHWNGIIKNAQGMVATYQKELNNLTKKAPKKAPKKAK